MHRKLHSFCFDTLTGIFFFALQSVKMKSAVRKLKTELPTALSLVFFRGKTAIEVSKHSFYDVI